MQRIPFYCNCCFITKERNQVGKQGMKAHFKTQTHKNNREHNEIREITDDVKIELHHRIGHHLTLEPYNNRLYRLGLINKITHAIII